MDWNFRGLGRLVLVLVLPAVGWGCASEDGAPGASETGDPPATEGTTSAGTDGTSVGTTDDPTSGTTTPGTSAGDDASRCDDALDSFGGDGESSGGDAGETFGGMGGDIPIGATVFAIRQDEVGAGTYVEVSGLVITTPVGSIDEGDLVFAQAPEGGPYSAIVVVSRWDLLETDPGDLVTVVGRVEYDGSYPRLVLDSDGEVIVDGTSALPPTFTVTLADLEDTMGVLAPHESALLRVETPAVSNGDVCPGEFALTAELRVDDLFLGDAAPTPTTGAQYSAILGALRHTSDGFEVAPRTTDDLVP